MNNRYNIQDEDEDEIDTTRLNDLMKEFEVEYSDIIDMIDENIYENYI